MTNFIGWINFDAAFTFPDNTPSSSSSESLMTNDHGSLLPMVSVVKYMFANAFSGPIDKRWE